MMPTYVSIRPVLLPLPQTLIQSQPVAIVPKPIVAEINRAVPAGFELAAQWLPHARVRREAIKALSHEAELQQVAPGEEAEHDSTQLVVQARKNACAQALERLQNVDLRLYV
jgi:hypothetical protein